MEQEQSNLRKEEVKWMAQKIDELRAENEKLREVLKRIPDFNQEHLNGAHE